MAKSMSQGAQGLGSRFAIGVDERGLTLRPPPAQAGELLVSLRWQAFEAARLLSATPDIEQQIADALVLLPAMQRWAASPRLRSRMDGVLVRACAEAESAQEAIELAEEVFSFLLTGEVAPPAA